MNRLILIGNGFDLAHGLKTSYKDFIFWYLADCFCKVDPYFFNYDDQLVSVKIQHPISFKNLVRSILERSSKSFILEKAEILEFFEVCYKNNLLCYLIPSKIGGVINNFDLNEEKYQLISSIKENLFIRINCD